MQVASSQELKEAVARRDPEIVVTDEALGRRVQTLAVLRTAANVAVFVILAAAIFMWANPARWELLETNRVRLVRQVMLGVGILLLFADYLMPVVRHYRIAARDSSGLKLVPRRPRS